MVSGSAALPVPIMERYVLIAGWRISLPSDGLSDRVARLVP
jgi:hypothetical protein